MGTIYIIKNLINNKCYIGQTKNYTRRIYEHRYNMKHNKCENVYLQEDVLKYGINNFTFNVLEDNINNDDLLEKETEWMNKYGGINSNNLYNEKDINGCNNQCSNNLSKSVSGQKNGMYGKHHTKESVEIMKVKVSLANKGKKRDDAFKIKMSKIRKQNPVISNTGRRKYSIDFVEHLRQIYSTYDSYKYVFDLYPNINKTTLRNLIKFGTSQYPNTYK